MKMKLALQVAITTPVCFSVNMCAVNGNDLIRQYSKLPKLQMLHDMWKNKLISWRLLDEDEYQRLLQEHNKKVNTGEIVESSHQPRSDKGKKYV
jgi:hypothetical protein